MADRPLFTPEELAEMAAFDAELGDDEEGYKVSLEERRESQERDKAAIYAEMTRAEKMRAARDARYYAKPENREKNRIRCRAYYKAHKEELAAYKRAYGKTHKDEIAAYQRAHHQENREKDNAAKRAYYEAHRAEIRAKHKVYSDTHKEERKARDKANRDQINARKRAYYAAHKEAAAASQRKHRQAHKDNIAAYQRAYIDAHRDEINAYRREYGRRRRAKLRALKEEARISGKIAELSKVSGLTYTDISVRLGISKSTLYKRSKTPGEFTLENLRKLGALMAEYGIALDIHIGGQAQVG